MSTMDSSIPGDSEKGDGLTKAPSKKFTWAEIKQTVYDLRKELSSLSVMVPSSISFRKYGGSRTRVYFLRTPQQGWEITLLYSDVIATNHHSEIRLDWKPLIDSSFLSSTVSGKCSREEQLLWERQRVTAWGIASYELHEESGRVLFPAASTLFVACVDDERQTPPLVPRALIAGGAGAALTPACCPSRAGLVAHAARADIWLAAASVLRTPVRLTYACRGAERLADDPKQAGVPCYVTQEEFSRYTGFWWQPRSDDDVYRIVYEEVDESDVKIYSFPTTNSSNGETEEFRFPRAGTSNARSTLRMVSFRLQPCSSSTSSSYYRDDESSINLTSSLDGDVVWYECADVRWYDLNTCIHDAFPWHEYLVRVGWTPCGQYIWCQLLDRKQQRLDLVLIHVDEFNQQFAYEQSPDAHPTSEEAGEDTIFNKQVLLSELAPSAWINVHDILVFLPSEDQTLVRFIWASEETGHLHLYLMECRLQDAKLKRRRMVDTNEMTGCVGPNIVSRTPLTRGAWEVIGKKIWLDVNRKLIYFVGLKETPLERHLYCCSYANPEPDNPILLTSPGNSCTVDMDKDCSMAVITCSNISTPPVTRVYRVVHGSDGHISLCSQGVLMEKDRESSLGADSSKWNGSRESSKSDSPTLTSGNDPSGVDIRVGNDTESDSSASCKEELLPPLLYEAPLSCGLRAHCAVYRPRGLKPRTLYPTLLHVYGGPEVQLVTNSHKGVRQLRMHMVAASGLVVVCVDGRGSKHRGRDWEAALRGRMGQIEIDDQVEALHWLAKETGFIDLERVAIHGWSYGGYLSLLALATKPRIFKLCIAGAPVTCWRLYDTAYTERYLGPPALAPHQYARAAVLTHAHNLPDTENRLLIIHGLADENVHFCHTAALVSELVRLGKPHSLQLYPGERHSLRAYHAAKHYEATLLSFLHNNL